jgi:hypothetical protein
VALQSIFASYIISTMVRLHPANDKLREAEFFFVLMERNLDSYEFKYFVSAFLAALYICGEHLRLFSKDPRFKDWYRDIGETLLANSEYQRLRKLRDVEIHKRGTESWQRVEMSFGEEGITVTGPLVLTVDLSSCTPMGSYQTPEMVQPEEHPVQVRWVWSTADELDVMDTCTNGLAVVQELIRQRGEMAFED